MKKRPDRGEWFGLPSYILHATRQAAKIMERMAERSTLGMKRIVLILFCAAGAGLSAAVMAYATRETYPFLPVPGNQLPVFAPALPGNSDNGADSVMPADDYMRIRKFEEYLAKQKRTRAGRNFCDSLLKARPHLGDSLRMVDSLFVSQ